MEFVQRPHPEPRQQGEKGIQLKRNVKVKKFDPHKVTPSLSATINLSGSSPKFSPRGVLDPQSSHVKVTPAELPAPRWPPKPLKRKDIESKPWYLWSMEETTEFYMGDQIRAERYGSYNPSFVKKLNDNSPPPKIGFGYKAGSGGNTLTAKNLKSSQSSSTSGKSLLMKPGTNNNNNQQSMETMTVATSATSRSRAIHRHKDQVEEEIRSRRMKYSDLVNEIEEVRRQAEELEIIAEREYDAVQSSIHAADRSDNEVKNAEVRALQVIATTRAGVNKILEHRQGQQESLREMVERQKENLRRMSIRDAVGRKIDPETLLKSYDQEVPEFENPKINEVNMGKYLHTFEAEKRKEQVRAAVRRGLKRFAALQKLKKKNPSGKKVVRLT